MSDVVSVQHVESVSSDVESSSVPVDDPNYELSMRIGDAEFKGIGRESVVRADYATWIEAVKLIGQSLAVRNAPQGDDATLEGQGGQIEKSWDRIYKRNGDQLSLNVIPPGNSRNADAILLIIYGYQTLFGQDGVKSTTIMDAAKQSGLRIDRVNRNMPKSHQQLVITGGAGKGLRYTLNNRGLQYAQELLDSMFE